jgi:hypothetical protein
VIILCCDVVTREVCRNRKSILRDKRHDDTLLSVPPVVLLMVTEFHKHVSCEISGSHGGKYEI